MTSSPPPPFFHPHPPPPPHSLCYALFLKATTGEEALPVLNVAREDLPMRTETHWLLRDAGVDVDALVYIADAEPVLRSAAFAGRVVLVDHNEANPRQRFLDAHVTEVVDHHEDSGRYADACAAAGRRRIVLKVGSTCSLVALVAAGVADPAAYLASGGDDAVPPPFPPALPETFGSDLARLLLGGVLVDTLNLNPVMQKTTGVDRAATEVLAPRAFPAEEDPRAQVTALFEVLEAKKFDTSSLTAAMSLRQDYKMFVMGAEDEALKVGISSVLDPLDVLATKGDLAAEMKQFSEKGGLDVLMIMAMFQAGREGGGTGPARQVALYPPHDRLLPALQQQATGDEGEDAPFAEMQLTPLPPPADGVAAFAQGNVAVSRKRFTPLLSKFLLRR